MNCLQESFKDIANFVAVYIAEAHAQDEWPLGKKVCLMQHKTMEERLSAARSFQKDYDFQIPLLVDLMDNNFDGLYSSWPERFYIIDGFKMDLVGFPSTEFGYDRAFLKNCLDYRKSVKQSIDQKQIDQKQID